MAQFLNIRNRKVYVPRRNTDERKYKSLYRFGPESVDFLVDFFMDAGEETRGGALSTKQRMQIFLRYMGDPGFQNGVGEDIGVHQTTVSKTINAVANKILEKSHHWIKFPTRQDEIMEARNLWQEIFNFPCAIGAIDCTHILINKPRRHGDEYINRKGLASINVQATCNAKELFTSINANWPGSVHDSRIFRNCTLNAVLSRYRGQAILLGDKGYGIAPWLLTPYRNAVTPAQIHYNRLHAQNRVIIERCFGQLKKRFPILMNTVRLKLNNIPKIIVCCAVLHNVAKHLNDEIDDLDDLVIPDDIEEEIIHDYNGRENEQRRLGTQRRDEISNILFNLNAE